jgi:hypothetical protein
MVFSILFEAIIVHTQNGSILDTLRDDGWGEEVLYITEDPDREAKVKEFKSLPQVRKSQALTPKSNPHTSLVDFPTG